MPTQKIAEMTELPIEDVRALVQEKVLRMTMCFNTPLAENLGEKENIEGASHCPLCDASMVFSDLKRKKLALIFLDIDGVLIELNHSDLAQRIKATLKQLFPDVKGYSGHQQHIALARHFNAKALKHLDRILRKVQESGQLPLVVLSSSWRHTALLEQQATETYAKHCFSAHLAGKTPIESEFEKYQSIEYQLGFDFYKIAQEKYGLTLNNRANAIEFWLKDHGFSPAKTNFIVIDDEHQECLSKFGEKSIEAEILLTESNAQAAIDVLCKNKIV